MAKRFGIMLDCSRNGVMKPREIKNLALFLSKAGYNMLMLYTEDVYEIPDEPYFGYLRGRYTLEELRSVEEYCNSLGIEIIPAIQTLAHLPKIFHWTTYRPILDIDDILLADSEDTYTLIRKMFAACREAYPNAKLINIGFDEAHHLGLGAYLDKNGYTPAVDIFLKHLYKVVEIAREFGFEPTMWSDMFFRMEHHGQYESLKNKEDSILSDKVLKLCPKDVSQVYWAYHHTDKDAYSTMLKAHKAFPGESWFAGCVWTWKGFVGNNRATMECMFPAVEACKEEGVENIVMTMWGDDGKECSFISMLPSIFAVKRFYDGVTDMNEIKKEFEELVGESFDDMMLLDLPGDFGMARVYNSSHHKYFLYNDPFSGFLDPALQPNAVESYRSLAERLEKLASKGGDFAYLYNYMATLCRTLEIKYDLGQKTRKAYEAKSTDLLRALAEKYSLAADAVETLAEAMRTAWYKENKPQGFEVQEHRLGGLSFRLRSLQKRIDQYVKGEVASLPELEEELLPVYVTSRIYKEGTNLPDYNDYRGIISVNYL